MISNFKLKSLSEKFKKDIEEAKKEETKIPENKVEKVKKTK